LSGPGSAEAEFAKLGEDIARIVARHFRELANAIGVQASNEEFRSAVTRAITTCFFVHVSRLNQQRFGNVRKGLLQVSRQARSARDNLRGLQAALETLPPEISQFLAEYRTTLGEIARGSLNNQTAWLDLESKIASVSAEAMKGKKRGRTRLIAFNYLLEGLAVAYRQATGRAAKLTWNYNEDRFEGPFLRLVEAALPIAKTLADATSKPLPIPKTEGALRQYVHEFTGPTAGKRRRGRKGR